MRKSHSFQVPRLEPLKTGHHDWHHSFQSFVLDLQTELKNAASDKASDKERGVVLRTLRRARFEPRDEQSIDVSTCARHDKTSQIGTGRNT